MIESIDGYVKGYNATWNNLAAKGARSNPTPSPPANSTSPVPQPSNTNTSDPSIPYNVQWVAFIVFPIILIAAIARKLKHKSGKYKERQHFSDSIKEKVLERQRHKCADCNRVLNVVDSHHKNGDRSDNKESKCVALYPNCLLLCRTRAHR
jgi:hypothetical protein